MLKMLKVVFEKSAYNRGNVKDVKVAGEILGPPQPNKKKKTLTSLTFLLF